MKTKTQIMIFKVVAIHSTPPPPPPLKPLFNIVVDRLKKILKTEAALDLSNYVSEWMKKTTKKCKNK